MPFFFLLPLIIWGGLMGAAQSTPAEAHRERE
jgi:hypothetical protein